MSTILEESSITPLHQSNLITKRSESKSSLRIQTTNESPIKSNLNSVQIPTIHVSSPTTILKPDSSHLIGKKSNTLTNFKKRTSGGSERGSTSSGSGGEEEEDWKDSYETYKKSMDEGVRAEDSIKEIKSNDTGTKDKVDLDNSTNSNTTNTTSVNSPGIFSFLPSINLDSFPSINLPNPSSLLPNFNLNLSSLLPKLNTSNISFLPGGQSDETPMRSRKTRGRARVGGRARIGEEENEVFGKEVGPSDSATSSSGFIKVRRDKRDRYSMDLRMEQATANGETFEDISDDLLLEDTFSSPSTPPASSFHNPFTSFSPLSKLPTLTSSPSTSAIPTSSAAFKESTKSSINPLTLQSIVRKNSETDALKLIREREERERKWRSEESFVKNVIARPGITRRTSSSAGLKENVLNRVESPEEILIGDADENETDTKIIIQKEVNSRRTLSEDTIMPCSSRNNSRRVDSVQEEDELLTTPIKLTPALNIGTESKPPSASTSKIEKEVNIPIAPGSQLKRKLSLFSKFGKGKTGSSSSSSGNASSSGKIEESKSKTAVIPLLKEEKAFSGSKIEKGKEKEKIRYIKVKTKNKSTKDFGKLFLAQELFISPPTSATSINSNSNIKGDSESLHSNQSTRDDASERSLNTEDHHHPSSSSSNSKVKNAIWSLKFSSDGRYLAAGGKDGIVRVWEVLSTSEERINAKHPESFSSSTTSNRLPSTTMPIFKSKPLREFKGHEADVLDLSWSKNNFLLSSSMDKTVRLWHVSKPDCLVAFQHLDFVTSIAFHPKDDRFFLSGSLDCKLRLWNIPEKRVEVWTELTDLITSVAFTSDGKLAIAGNFVGVCMMFEVETFRYHSQFIAKSTRGKNSRGKKITSIVPFPINSSAGGAEKLLVTSNDSRIRLFQVSDKSLEAKYAGHENTSSQIRANFSDDGRFIISGSEDRHVYIWDSGLLNKDLNWSLRKKNQETGYESFQMSVNVITCACFAPTNTRDVLAASEDPIFSKFQSSYSTTSTSTIPASRTTTQDSNSSSMGAADSIIVVADDLSGVISIFRNSTLIGEDIILDSKKMNRRSRAMT